MSTPDHDAHRRRDTHTTDGSMNSINNKRVDAPSIVATKDHLRGDFGSFTPERWQGEPIPAREWCVDGIIPSGNVTYFGGDGGVGKTLLAMQLQVAGALGSPWLGVQMGPTKSLGIYCEDDTDELHRRSADIAAHYGASLDALGNMHLAGRVGEDNLLVTFDHRDIAGATPLYHAIAEHAVDIGARLVIFDSLHDVFGGNEIMRTHARQFIGLVRKLALKINGAVLLCAHPSQAGMSSGSGQSGSTGWNNAVRSRLYLTKPNNDEGADDGVRLLKIAKANYAALSTIELTWRNGVLVRNASSDDAYGQAAQIFLSCLDKVNAEGRYASPAKTSPAYAPKVFLRMAQAKGIAKKNLELAMERLFAENKIEVGGHRKGNRHHVESIVKVTTTMEPEK
jgi:RecA-family ATPase